MGAFQSRWRRRLSRSGMTQSARPHDTSADRSLSGASVSSMRRVLATGRGSAASANEVREILRASLSEARDRGVRAEQLIVTLKSLWSALPEVQYADDRKEEARLLDELVRICISEYYR